MRKTLRDILYILIGVGIGAAVATDFFGFLAPLRYNKSDISETIEVMTVDSVYYSINLIYSYSSTYQLNKRALKRSIKKRIGPAAIVWDSTNPYFTHFYEALCRDLIQIWVPFDYSLKDKLEITIEKFELERKN